ncbi:MAG: cytidylate kinase-like family protein [Christensenellaceae bacterium]|nr:cytidylate kinase-like family protein [Christensenellaceae bacterium]
MKKIVITLGRQFGSGGRVIGQRVAQELGILYYDKELLTRAAKESGISEDLFHSNDEKPTNSLLYSLAMSNFSGEMPLNHRIFLAQFDVIKQIAHEGSCVIVGRCADYALRDEPGCANVFVHAPLEYRIKRGVEEYGLPEKNARGIILRTDKQRANYYNFYTNKKWGSAESYGLSVDSSSIGADGCVKLIKDYALIKSESGL